MPKIIAFAGEKGGTGKSLVAIHCAVEWYLRERRVLLVDADTQGTVTTWKNVADEAQMLVPPVDIIGDNVRLELPELIERHSAAGPLDFVLVDCPGRAGSRQTGALLSADLAIVPCGPSPTDVWAFGAFKELVDEARGINEGLRVSVLMNRTTRTRIAKQAKGAIDAIGLPLMDVALPQRTLFSESLAGGDGVTRFKPGSVAAYELRRVTDSIEHLLAT
jgi:chromosome partitioning protein